MRKLTAIILLLLFCNSFFCYVYLSFSLTKARFEAAKAIADADKGFQTAILCVNVKDVQKDERDEVWYRNKLYDVVKREKKAGAQFLFLLADEDEQSVLSAGHNYFQSNNNTLSINHCHFTSVVKSETGNSNIYITPSDFEIYYYKFSRIIAFNTRAIETENCFSIVLTPPPEFDLLLS